MKILGYNVKLCFKYRYSKNNHILDKVTKFRYWSIGISFRKDKEINKINKKLQPAYIFNINLLLFHISITFSR